MIAKYGTNSHSFVKFVLLDGNDFVVCLEFDAGERSVGVFDGTDVAFVGTLDHPNHQSDQPISRSAAYEP